MTPTAAPPSTIRRLGFWCVLRNHANQTFSVPLREGIGIFTLSLVDAMNKLPDGPEIVVWATPDEHALYRDALPDPRIKILPLPTPISFPRRAIARIAAAIARPAKAVGAFAENAFGSNSPILKASRQTVRSVWRHFWMNRATKPIALALAPFLALGHWAVSSLHAILFAVATILFLPCGWIGLALDKVAKKLVKQPPLPPDGPVDASVDLWVAPYLGCDIPPHLPYVLFVHDLVTHNFPERFEPDVVGWNDHCARVKSKHALLVACMSKTILKNDLLGHLGLAVEKTRMVYCPTPDDKQSDAAGGPVRPELARFLRSTRYLTYPTMYRPHKNIETLVKAFVRLRQDPRNHDLHLVFTGQWKELEHYPTLRSMIALARLEPYIHFLGPVARSEVIRVFSNAQATIVSSLYEETILQIREAIGQGCPVACSRIPAFVEQCEPLGDAMIYFDPLDAADMAKAAQRILDARVEVAARQTAAAESFRQTTWTDAAADWLGIFEEAAQVRDRGPKILFPSTENQPLELALAMPGAIEGGTWESAAEIVNDLVALNERRRDFRLTFIAHPDQPKLERIPADPDRLRILRDQFNVLAPFEARRLLGPEAGETQFVYYAGQARERALGLDAIFFLNGFQFYRAFAPVVPYGVLAHDMVLFQLPDLFPAMANELAELGIRPTLAGADLVVCTSDATRELVEEHCPAARNRSRVVPLGCASHLRLSKATPEAIEGVDRDFILNIANVSPHKGGDVMLRAFALLKRTLGDACPALVVAGVDTEMFQSGPNTETPFADHIERVRGIIAESGLVVGKDLHLLGKISEGRLAWAMRNCRAVVNAARCDNGTFCLIEGHYFGRPTVTSDYPAARELCERFHLPTRYFPVGDHESLSVRMREALNQSPIEAVAPQSVRAALDDREYSSARFAERLYDHLVELARAGRRLRRAA